MNSRGFHAALRTARTTRMRAGAAQLAIDSRYVIGADLRHANLLLATFTDSYQAGESPHDGKVTDLRLSLVRSASAVRDRLSPDLHLCCRSQDVRK